MKTNKKILIFGVLALMVFFGSIVSKAYACNYKKGDSYKWSLKDKFFKKVHIILGSKVDLQLSDEQAAKVKDLKLKTKKDLVMKEAEIEVVEIDITAALHTDVIDLKSVNSLNKKKYKLKNKKADFLVESFAALKSILSDDQKQKLKSIYHSKSKGSYCPYCQANKKGSGFTCPYANKSKGSGKGSGYSPVSQQKGSSTQQ